MTESSRRVEAVAVAVAFIIVITVVVSLRSVLFIISADDASFCDCNSSSSNVKHNLMFFVKYLGTLLSQCTRISHH